MKISIDTTTDTLIAANNLLQNIYEIPVFPSTTQNVYKSIGFDVADKLDKKVKTTIKNRNLTNNEKLKLSLKYHEAWGLQKIITDLVPRVENDYQQNLLTKLAGQLNQKIV